MTAWFETLGIGSYYLRIYALYAVVLLVAGGVTWRVRHRLPKAVKSVVLCAMVIVCIRLVALDNPIALRFYLNHLTPAVLGARQWDAVELDIRKYARRITQPSIANLAVGSSQVGAIFSHWAPETPQGLAVFSLAGMKTLDYLLYREEIAARNPERVILYVSAFDLTAGPELFSWPLAPSHPMAIWDTVSRVTRGGAPPDRVAEASHNFIASQLLPEYRYAFIFRAFLKQWTERGAMRTALDWWMPTLHAAAAAESAVLQADPSLEERTRQFLSYYMPEWLDYNYRFLRAFVAFCRERGIDVVIVEGQVSPLVKGEKLDALGRMVRSRFAELALLYPNVRVVHVGEAYTFVESDYRDFTHVSPEAARVFTRELSGLVGEAAVDISGPCDLTFRSGWHGFEGGAEDWLRWSSGSGRLRIRARESGDLVLRGDVLSLARPNVVDVLINGQAAAKWTISDPAWTFHPFAPLTIPVKAGEDVVVQLDGQAAAASQAADPRPLTIAVKNLTLTRAGGPPCVVVR